MPIPAFYSAALGAKPIVGSLLATVVIPPVVVPPVTPVPSIAFASATASVAEGAAGATTTVANRLNVVRNGATGAIVVNLGYGGTATAGSDYAVPPASVTIAAGQDFVTFDVVVNGDGAVEADETIVITATIAAYPLAAAATRTITIGNDDAAMGSLSLSSPLVAGAASSGTISGATAGSTIVSNVEGLVVNSADRTYTYNGSTAGSVTEGLVETLGDATKSTAITVASVGFPAFEAPVADWRAVAIDVTDLAGTQDAAMLAQQASPATKTNGAGFNASTSGATGRIFKLPSHTTPYLFSFHNNGLAGTISKTANQPKIEVSTDGGATWSDSGYTPQTPLSSISDVEQSWAIPAGPAKWIRLTIPALTSASPAFYPKVNLWPASGKPAIVLLSNNSQGKYFTDPREFILALQAANPTLDPVGIGWGMPSASAANLNANIDTAIASRNYAIPYAHWGQMAFGADTSGSDEKPLPSSKYPDLATLHSKGDPIINTAANKLAAAGIFPFATPVTYRGYAGTDATGPDALPGYGAADHQENGAHPFNRELLTPKLASLLPAQYDTTYKRFRFDTYLHGLLIRGAMDAKGIHLTGNVAAVQAHHARTWGRYWATGTLPTPEIELRASEAEAALTQSAYDELVYALNTIDQSSTGYSTIEARRAALRPLMLLKMANIAVAAFEASKTTADKTTAQNALAAAQAGNAPTGYVTAAYGVTVNLSGTTTDASDTALPRYQSLTARIAAVSSRTILQRIGIDIGSSTASPATFNAYIGATGTIALLNTSGAASGLSVGITGLVTDGGVNGIQAANGVSPNEITAANNRSYTMTGTNGVATATFSGATVGGGRKWRLWFFTSRKETTDRSMTIAATGNGVTQTSRTLNGGGDGTTANAIGDYLAIDGIVPGSDGTFSLTSAHVGSVTAVPWNSLILEEYTE